MRYTRVSNDALDVLRDEPDRMTKVYVYLCTNVDRKTGLTGAVKRISYQSMIELLHVPATEGRAEVRVKKSVVQNVLKRLEKLKLIQPMGNLVFLLRYESSDYSVSRRLIRGQYGVNTGNSTQDADLNQFSEPNITGVIPFNSDVNTPHISINQSNTAREKFEMTETWVPSERFADLAASSTLDVTKSGVDRPLLDSVLGEFRWYWLSENPPKLRNQWGWEKALLNRLLFAKQNGGNVNGVNKNAGSQQRSSGRKLSAAEQNAQQAAAWAAEWLDE